MRANARGLPPPPDRAADAARRRRARPLDRPCSGRRCRRRCCWRRSASRRSSTTDGELATARAAAAVGAADDRQHRLATSRSRRSPRRAARRRAGSSSTGPTTRRWSASFVGRAEAAGYGAIVVTVDTFIPGWKPRDLQQAWLPFLDGDGRRQLLPGPGLPRRRSSRRPRRTMGAATGHFLGVQANPVADLGRPRLAARADLAADPGQGHPARRRRPRGGAARARRHRRLQPRRPPGRRRDRLARRAARRSPRRSASDLAILFDSGVRGGADVLKALALGADAVCLGRPYVWGLALERPGRRRNGAEDGPRRARPDDGPLRPHPSPDAARRPRRSPDRLPRPSRRSIFGKSGGTRSTFWPPGREPSSAELAAALRRAPRAASRLVCGR